MEVIPTSAQFQSYRLGMTAVESDRKGIETLALFRDSVSSGVRRRARQVG